MIIHNVLQRSQEWHELRAGRITGTRFKSMMMGKSTKGYQDLASEIAAEVVLGTTLDDDYNYLSPVMERGVELEPIAREVFSEEVGPVEEVGFITPESHTYKDWLGTSPDGIIGDSGLEIKCPLAKTHFNYLTSDDMIMPSEYIHQVQGSLYVTGLKSWYFMSYYPKMKPFIIEVFPDRELFAKYAEEVEKMVDLVKSKIENYIQYE